MAAPQQAIQKQGQQAVQAAEQPSDPKALQRKALYKFLCERKVQFDRMLKGHELTFDKLLGSALLATAKVDALLRCQPESLFLSLLDAAELGLSVHWGPRGEAALVPFGDKATLVVGYRGMLKIMRRGGVSAVVAEAVREGEPFRHAITERGVILRHTPAHDETAAVLKFYAAAWTPHDERPSAVVVVPKSKIDRIRDDVKAKTKPEKWDVSPWNLWETEMGLKSTLRQLFKVGNFDDVGVERALEIDQKHSRIREEDVVEGSVVPETKAPSLPSATRPPDPPIEVRSREPEAVEAKPEKVVEAKPEKKSAVAQPRSESGRAATFEPVPELADVAGAPSGGAAPQQQEQKTPTDPDTFTDSILASLAAAAAAGDEAKFKEIGAEGLKRIPDDRKEEFRAVYKAQKAVLAQKKTGGAA